MEHVLEREQWVPRPRSEVFPFFAEARNLERITPPFMRFTILTTGDIPMHPGTLIDYRIRVYGVPMRWRTLIETFDAPDGFVDTQVKGPYAKWHHTHRFFDERGGTRLTDRVVYRVGFGPFGEIARRLMVRRTVERIFDYRREVIAEKFGHE